MYYMYLSVFLEIELQRFNVIVKTKRCHGKENVVPCDGLAFLSNALVASPTCTCMCVCMWDGGRGLLTRW